MIHGEPLPSNHYMVLINYVMGGCHNYNLPYLTNDSHYLELIGVPLKWPVNLVHLNYIFLYFLANRCKTYKITSYVFIDPYKCLRRAIKTNFTATTRYPSDKLLRGENYYLLLSYGKG
jgi:hypothetical protein